MRDRAAAREKGGEQADQEPDRIAAVEHDGAGAPRELVPAPLDGRDELRVRPRLPVRREGARARSAARRFPDSLEEAQRPRSAMCA